MNGTEYQDSFPLHTRSAIPGKIGVVTVTFNSASVLPEFFASLDAQDYKNFVLFAVDNASTDETLRLLSTRSPAQQMTLGNETNLGVAAGNNIGIRAALESGCEYVLLLNNDVTFAPDLFSKLVNGIIELAADMTVPMMRFYDRPNRIWAAGGRFQPWLGFRSCHRLEGKLDDGRYEELSRLDYTPTCCVLIRSTLFSRVGLMDERYFVYSDDVDFMFRARKAGTTIRLIPSAKLQHKVNSLTGGASSDFTCFYGARGRSLFLCKHLGRFPGALLTHLYSLFYLVRPWFGLDSKREAAARRRGIQDGRQVAFRKVTTPAEKPQPAQVL